MARADVREWESTQALDQLRAWALEGLTDEQIAANMHIATSTLYAWKLKSTGIAEALKECKAIADSHVENALYKRAIGYDVTERVIEDSEKNGHMVRTTIKHIPGDVTAQIFWLKNRQPESWRDKREPVQADTSLVVRFADDAKEGGG